MTPVRLGFSETRWMLFNSSFDSWELLNLSQIVWNKQETIYN